MYTGFCKGGSDLRALCFGCTEKATEDVRLRGRREKVGYCKEHSHAHPTVITIQKGKSLGGLIAVVFVVTALGPVSSLVPGLPDGRLPRGTERPGRSSSCFFLGGGRVLLNLLSYGYWHYCHWALQYGEHGGCSEGIRECGE